MSAKPDPLEYTTLRDHKGRFLPGTASARNPDGTMARKFYSVASLLRKRWRDDHPDAPRQLIEQLEALAFKLPGVRDRERLEAANMLVKLHDGAHAYGHDLVNEEQAEGATTGAPSRVFMSVNEVDRITSALAHSLGVEPDKLLPMLEAAYEAKLAEEDDDDGCTVDG